MSVTFLTNEDEKRFVKSVNGMTPDENGNVEFQASADEPKDGITPHIGDNGNWFIGDTDTGMPSRGETGAQGPQGEKGDTGPQGEKGETGAQGPAYVLTDADRAAIVAEVIQSLGGNPVFGYVDENNNIIVSGNLADGTYSVKYEMEDGSTVDIGQLVVAEDEPAQTYTNLANPSDANWKEGKRLNSSYAEVDAPGMVTTNLIEAVKGNIIRVKGLSFGSSSNERVCQYLDGTANNALVSTVNTDLFSTSGGITTITLDGSAVMANSTHVRICGTLTGTSADVIITVNEEIA